MASVQSQRVGIQTQTPRATLHVNGKIQLGNDAIAPRAGTICWNVETLNFEGWTGIQWKSLTTEYERWGISYGVEQDTAKGSLISSNDQFGAAISMTTTMAAIGAPGDDFLLNDNRGRVYIFERMGDTWAQSQLINAPGPHFSKNFGESLAMNDSILIIGAPATNISGNSAQGIVYVYKWNGSAWAYDQQLLSSDGSSGDAFGSAVGVHGNHLAVGAPVKLPRGSVYMFEFDGIDWMEQDILSGTLPNPGGDFFGGALAIEDSTLIIGAYSQDVNGIAQSGVAYAFSLNGSGWSISDTLIPMTAQTADFMGQSVALRGNTALVGAPARNSASGVVFAFARSGTQWVHTADLLPADPANFRRFGWSIELLDQYLLVGASGESIAPSQTGRAYVFKRAGPSFTEIAQLRASNEDAVHRFASAVAGIGDHLLIGAPFTSGGGLIYMFNKY